METHDLFLSCKKGDLARLQYLVETREVAVNLRDKWDSTPLYYACLCGHDDVVKYLLENGARCEANTFDGERCLYGALNNDIRNLLRSFKTITSQTIRRDHYSESLRRLLECSVYTDVTFIVRGARFPAHRCILCARSSYFKQLFSNKWKDRQEIHLTNKLVQPKAFHCIMSYIYTAKLECPFDDLHDLLLLARQCQLENLIIQLEKKMKSVVTFEMGKPGVNVTVISLEPAIDNSDLQNDFSTLAEQALPPGICSESNLELPFLPERFSDFADICFSVDGHRFLCHKAFFCERSDYFKALLCNHFGEVEERTFVDERQLEVVHLSELTAEVFVEIVYYIYTDKCELNSHLVYDILHAADIYLLPGLKRQCANAIGQFLQVDNIVAVLRTARLFSMTRLEDQCAEFIATNLEKVIMLRDFAEFVIEDAESIQGRHETDTISIIDDVRYHISSRVQTFSDMDEADEKLALIDQFLDRINLDA